MKGTAARMEQLAVHSLLVQLHVPELVSEGEVPPASGGKGFGGGMARGGSGEAVRRPVWLGKDYQAEGQASEAGTQGDIKEALPARYLLGVDLLVDRESQQEGVHSFSVSVMELS